MFKKRHKSKGWQTRAYLLLIIFVLLISTASLGSRRAAHAQAAGPFPTVTLPAEALPAPSAPSGGRTTQPGPPPKLETVLQELARTHAQSPAAAQAFAAERHLRLDGDRVQVRVITPVGQQRAAEAAVKTIGGSVTIISQMAPALQAWVPIVRLQELAEGAAVAAVNQAAAAVLFDTDTLSATSEGLVPLNAPAWHVAGRRGSGVKIAVIDGGFEGYTALLGSDLPATVTAKNFVDGEDEGQVDGTSVHGTACAELIYDIAPDAQYFLVKIGTDLDLEEAVNYAIDQNVDIISTSLGWYNVTPGDGTGFFADLVDLAAGQGITWLTAAGNDREAHWGGSFNDPDANQFHNFGGTQEVNFFGPGDGSAYVIPPNYLLRVFVRWDDWTDVDQDYALHIVAWQGNRWQPLATSDNPQTGGPGQRPAEQLIGFTSGAPKPYGFMIERINSTRSVNLEIVAPKVARLDKIVVERSLANLADAPSAVTVGAVAPDDPFALEYYSSQGPANGPGGTAAGGLLKPDIAAYAQVSTESYGPGAFAGTSASTPHVAGAAALVKGAFPGYAPPQVRDYLLNDAVDLGDPGADSAYGHGRAFLPDPQTIHGISLHEGWNMISSYIEPTDPTIESALAGIESNMILLKNGDGQIYWPDLSINEIGRWDVRQGYQIYMTGADALTITGQPVDPAQTPILLSPGWTLVPYLRDTPMPVEQALSSISSDIYLAKNGYGEVYWPSLDLPINQLGEMQPGQGYQLLLDAPATLTYPPN